MMNLTRSEVYFGVDVLNMRRKEVVDMLGIKEVDCHEKYLGLPTFVGRCKKDLFLFIKDRVWNKLKG